MVPMACRVISGSHDKAALSGGVKAFAGRPFQMESNDKYQPRTFCNLSMQIAA